MLKHAQLKRQVLENDVASMRVEFMLSESRDICLFGVLCFVALHL